jgi:hypothetical protein
MLEIRPERNGLVVFDTDEREPIMRFAPRDDAADLVAEPALTDPPSLGPVIRPIVGRTRRG